MSEQQVGCGSEPALQPAWWPLPGAAKLQVGGARPSHPGDSEDLLFRPLPGPSHKGFGFVSSMKLYFLEMIF